MSFGIIIKGKHSPSSSKRFRPHYNNAMGKYYHTAKDYVGDMKKNGMEPYNPDDVKSKMSKKGDYKPSDWAKKMTAVGCEQIKQNGEVSGAFKQEMASKLKTEVPEKIARQTEGGTYTE